MSKLEDNVISCFAPPCDIVTSPQGIETFNAPVNEGVPRIGDNKCATVDPVLLLGSC